MIKYVVFALRHCFVASILIGCATKSPLVADNYDYYPLAIKTFDIGMKYISERYIRPIRVSDLAIEGLRGLKSIDPAFRVTVTPTRIKIDGLRSSELNYSKPLGENTKEWAETMAAIVRASRAQSLLIEKTSYERIFEVIFDSATSLLDAFSH